MGAVADPVGGALFRLATAAAPDAVWAALTCAATTPRWLYGIALSSSWSPGDRVTGRIDAAPGIAGTVLFAAPTERLAYALEDPSGPVTFVDWCIRPAVGGSVVRLRVDEPGADDADLHEAWLPVVTALGDVLAAQAESRP